jgi:hypothetical protein
MILSACAGDTDDPVAEQLLPAKLEVSPRTLTIDSSSRATEFVVSNTGEEGLRVVIESDDFVVDTVSATLPGGTDITVEVSLAGRRVDGTVSLSWTSVGFGIGGYNVSGGVGNAIPGDTGVVPISPNVVTVDVSVEPLDTETRTDTVVDTSAKVSAGRFTSWSIDAPAGAIVSVELSSTDTVNTWFMTDESYEAYARGDRFLIIAGSEFANARRANYTTPPLPEGRYELVVSNQGAWLFSRTVTVQVDMEWDVTIPASD